MQGRRRVYREGEGCRGKGKGAGKEKGVKGRERV